MKKFILTTEILCAVVAVVFGVLWVRYPNGHHYDALGALFTGITALLEIVRHLFGNEGSDIEHLEEALKGTAESLQKLIAAQASGPVPPPQQAAAKISPAKPDPMYAAVALRAEIEKRVREYAKLKGIADADVFPDISALLNRIPNMNEVFRQGVHLFLNQTNDLAHVPEAFVVWAASNGKTYVDLLDLVIKNARTA